MKVFYRLFQLLVAFPILLLVTILTAVSVIVGCTMFGSGFWSHYPPMLWSRLMCWGFLLPVRVEGLEHLDRRQSYVFVANHQGAYDIFLVTGFLGRDFKWMMKRSLRKLPLIGKACECAGYIFVDKSGPKAIQHTVEQGRRVLHGGASVVVFPEGARTFTGHMGTFHRGAFLLAEELRLPVVPVTIDGSFDVLPRQRGFNFLTWHPLRLVVHEPIFPVTGQPDEMPRIIQQSYEAIMNALPAKYQGALDNHDNDNHDNHPAL